MAVVRQSFKPEFINRLDEIVLFDALGSEELTQIVALQVQALQRRLTDRRITLDVDEGALEWLAMTGYDPVYGARPLRRLVQSAIGRRAGPRHPQRHRPRRRDRQGDPERIQGRPGSSPRLSNPRQPGRFFNRPGCSTSLPVQSLERMAGETSARRLGQHHA
jgi:hypothetical protein